MSKTKVMLLFCWLFFFVTSAFSQNIQFAIVTGNLDQVKSIVEENPDVMKSTIGPSKLSLLAFAVAMGSRECAEFFIEKGMDMNWKSPSGYNLLHIAAGFSGDTTVTKLLIEKGMDVNSKVESGKKHAGLTALHIAAKKGHKDMAVILIRSGADINSQEPIEGNTPLHFALGNCHDQLAELLNNNNANMSLVNSAGILLEHYKKLPGCSEGSIFESKSHSFGIDFKIKNPTDFPVLVGLYLENKGHKISIAAKSEETVIIPEGDYLIYCLYANNPGIVYQVKQLSLYPKMSNYNLKISKKPMEEYKILELHEKR